MSMCTNVRCADEPQYLFDTTLCLSELSKNLRSELTQVDRDLQRCAAPECQTLKTLDMLRLDVTTHVPPPPNQPCDSALGQSFDGPFSVPDLVTAYKLNGENRGVHAGNFRWKGNGVYAVGTISGITNAGTHREPGFQPCQQCRDVGVMEGRFCGAVVRTVSDELRGCQIVGMYRIQLNADGPVRGTLEGMIVCGCRA